MNSNSIKRSGHQHIGGTCIYAVSVLSSIPVHDHYDITGILLKVALNSHNLINQSLTKLYQVTVYRVHLTTGLNQKHTGDMN